MYINPHNQFQKSTRRMNSLEKIISNQAESTVHRKWKKSWRRFQTLVSAQTSLACRAAWFSCVLKVFISPHGIWWHAWKNVFSRVQNTNYVRSLFPLWTKPLENTIPCWGQLDKIGIFTNGNSVCLVKSNFMLSSFCKKLATSGDYKNVKTP